MSTDQTTPAGWYPDPRMAGAQRYWDGEQWTDHTAAMSQKAGLGVGGIAVGVALGIAIVIVAVMVVVQLATADDGAKCATDNADRATHGLPARDC